MRCDVSNRPDGWSDITFDDPFSKVISHCRDHGLPLVTALDIGCKGRSIGEVLIRHFSPEAIFGFEPTPRSYDEVKLAYASERTVEVLNLAVSDQDGRFPFYVRPGPPNVPPNPLSATPLLVRGSGNSGNSFTDPSGRIAIEVETVRLDTWAHARNVRSFDIVKLDIEGHELQALQGMGSYVDTINCLIVEVRFDGRPTAYHEVATTLANHQLQLFSIASLHYLDRQLSWGDFVFARIA